MKYFLDTEFLEGTQKKWFGQTKPTIDLISIGIVAEDGREYYAISKDFNLKEAWNRYDEIKDGFRDFGLTPNYKKVYWIRDNVLKPIWKELIEKERHYYLEMFKRINVWTKYIDDDYYEFTYKEFKRLINKYGKSNKQIAEEVYEFCSNNYHESNGLTFQQCKEYPLYDKFKPEFYGYYCDYDWVVFCWLFGKMINLPKGFPMYCIDLKQELDRYSQNKIYTIDINTIPTNIAIQDYINKYVIKQDVTKHPNYPKQTNEHNALADAKWNFELYKFLNKL